MIDTRIRIFYPADPLGMVPGGVDTFVRGLIKWAPQDLHFSLVGMTTDPLARPVSRWTRGTLGERVFDMFPVCAVRDAGSRGPVPLSVRFMAGVNRDRLAIRFGPHQAAIDGAPSPTYDETKISAYMKKPELEIAVDVGVGRGQSAVWTCDLTKGYIEINGDYRS